MVKPAKADRNTLNQFFKSAAKFKPNATRKCQLKNVITLTMTLSRVSSAQIWESIIYSSKKKQIMCHDQLANWNVTQIFALQTLD